MKRSRLELIAASCTGLAALLLAWHGIHQWRLQHVMRTFATPVQLSSAYTWAYAAVAVFFLAVTVAVLRGWKSAWWLLALAGSLLIVYGLVVAVVGMEDYE